MKKLKKLNLEDISQSKFEQLEADQMALFTGGTTYAPFYTFL